jgi:hypothetical protein
MDYNYPAYGCSICNGLFQVIENDSFNAEATRQQLIAHLSKCTPEQPFVDDSNIVGFI